MFYKCKMCGGQIDVTEKASVAQCPYCATTQTFPMVDDDARRNLFNRANDLRLACEFDRAANVYEKLIEEGCNDSEAYWGLVLCRYGIEYVKSSDSRMVPTCHRVQKESIASDVDFRNAYKYADETGKQVYLSQAKQIARIQQGILKIAEEEKPYDVFICYKERDSLDRRTQDSVIANDIYHELTEEGFKVFYAAVTLEDHLGEDYEPYIFAALNSARVMIVIGTKPEYFKAVWVRNEWSRFLKMMETDSKKKLYPCYRDMSAYDLPDEFAHLQSQDMSKIGFINDIVRGIKKLFGTEQAAPAAYQVSAGSNTDALLKRAYGFLEFGEWENAASYCEKVLDIDPENEKAYTGLLLAEYKVPNLGKLSELSLGSLDSSINYKKALRYSSPENVTALENCRKQCLYNEIVKEHNNAHTYEACVKVCSLCEQIPGFAEADEIRSDSSAKALTYCQDSVKQAQETLDSKRRELERIDNQIKQTKDTKMQFNSNIKSMEEENIKFSKLSTKKIIAVVVIALLSLGISAVASIGAFELGSFIVATVVIFIVLYVIVALVFRFMEKKQMKKTINNKNTMDNLSDRIKASERTESSLINERKKTLQEIKQAEINLAATTNEYKRISNELQLL